VVDGGRERQLCGTLLLWEAIVRLRTRAPLPHAPAGRSASTCPARLARARCWSTAGASQARRSRAQLRMTSASTAPSSAQAWSPTLRRAAACCAALRRRLRSVRAHLATACAALLSLPRTAAAASCYHVQASPACAVQGLASSGAVVAARGRRLARVPAPSHRWSGGSRASAAMRRASSKAQCARGRSSRTRALRLLRSETGAGAATWADITAPTASTLWVRGWGAGEGLLQQCRTHARDAAFGLPRARPLLSHAFTFAPSCSGPEGGRAVPEVLRRGLPRLSLAAHPLSAAAAHGAGRTRGRARSRGGARGWRPGGYLSRSQVAARHWAAQRAVIRRAASRRAARSSPPQPHSPAERRLRASGCDGQA